MNAIVTQMIILFILVVVGYIISKKKNDGCGFRPQIICFCHQCSMSLSDTFIGNGRHSSRQAFYNTFTYCRICYLCNPDRRPGFLLPHYLPIKATDRGIYSFMLAFGNVGFIGYPIVASIFGANAVFYASILNFPSTLLIFVFGTLFISGDQGKMKFKWDTLYCPAMIASYLSILI